MGEQGQGGDETIPGSHGEPVVWPGQRLLGKPTGEGGHCPQVTLAPGEGPSAVSLCCYSVILLVPGGVMAWESEGAATYGGTSASWEHPLSLSEPEILPLPMS